MQDAPRDLRKYQLDSAKGHLLLLAIDARCARRTARGNAWARESGEGFSVKLNAIPIGTAWNGILKLLPPFVAEDDIPDKDRV